MNCEQIRENLAAFIDGELDEPDIAGIQEHLKGCEGCRQELEAFRQTARALEEFLEPRAMREGVAEGVLSALASERGKRRVPLVTRLGWALTGAAAAVLILAVFGFMGMEGGGEVVFADEVVDEALADQTRALDLFKKQAANSAIDPVSGVRLIRIELELSGLKEKTARLEKLLTCSNHPRKGQIEDYLTSVRDLLLFVEKPSVDTPEVISIALRRKAMNVSSIQGVVMVRAAGSAGTDVEIPKDLDEKSRGFVLAKLDLYRGNFEKAAHAFNTVARQAPGSQIAEDARYWKWYAELHADGCEISVGSEGQFPMPHHPALREEMRKDFLEWIEPDEGALKPHPNMEKMRRMLEKFGDKMGIHIETVQDADGNTVIKVERKDERGNNATSIIKIKSTVGGEKK